MIKRQIWSGKFESKFDLSSAKFKSKNVEHFCSCRLNTVLTIKCNRVVKFKTPSQILISVTNLHLTDNNYHN